MSEYAEIVNSQAVELERRMHEAGVSIVIRVIGDRPNAKWRITLSRPEQPDVDVQGISLSTTLWLACKHAGLTDGLEAP